MRKVVELRRNEKEKNAKGRGERKKKKRREKRNVKEIERMIGRDGDRQRECIERGGGNERREREKGDIETDRNS